MGAAINAQESVRQRQNTKQSPRKKKPGKDFRVPGGKGQRFAPSPILRGIIGSWFARRDSQRGFSLEQRRILWNTAPQRKCVTCSKLLSWDEFTIDHIDPYSKAGGHSLKMPL
jgi:hypothetical protein